jgi:hypothetical protein
MRRLDSNLSRRLRIREITWFLAFDRSEEATERWSVIRVADPEAMLDALFIGDVKHTPDYNVQNVGISNLINRALESLNKPA